MNKVKIKLTTEFKETNVITGASVNLSIEDARGLMTLVTTKPIGKQSHIDVPESELAVLKGCKEIVKTIATAILFTAGPSTDIDDLIRALRV